MKMEQFNELHAMIELDGLCSALRHVADDIGDNVPEELDDAVEVLRKALRSFREEVGYYIVCNAGIYIDNRENLEMANTLSSWSERVKYEYKELSGRIARLRTFLETDPKISEQDMLLLKSQLDTMKAYANILLARLHYHNVEIDVEIDEEGDEQ